MGIPLHILSPGQGAQAVGMGKQLYASSPAAKKFFDDANRAIGFDLSALCFNGPAEELNKTDKAQPALYVVGIASYHAAVEAGIFNEADVTSYAGLSLGEYTALHLAGVFSFEQGLKLVAARGKYMQEAAVATPSGMVAFMGADEAGVRKLCEEQAQGEVLVPANFNTPGQIVVSGAKAACERALKAADGAGFKGVPLAVAGAFHSPLMQSGADKMKAELAHVAFAEPKKTVYSNVTGKAHGSADSIKPLLVDQITHPVRWQQDVETMIAGGEARYIELAPGTTLAGMGKRIGRLRVESLSSKLDSGATS
jgi:[acyl-carrier-protein] S-malonyltransferase